MQNKSLNGWVFVGIFLALILVVLCQPLLAGYTDPEQRFSVEPPDGWQILTDKSGIAIFKAPDDVTSLMILPGEVSESENLDTMASSYERLLKEARPGSSLRMLKEERVEIAGQPALQREYILEEGKGKRAATMATFIKVGKLSLTFVATADEKEFARFKPAFRESLQTLRFPTKDRVSIPSPAPEPDRDVATSVVKITSPAERQEFITVNPQAPLKFKITRYQGLKRVTVVVKGSVTQTQFDVYDAEAEDERGRTIPPDYEWSLNTPAFYGANRVKVIAEYLDGSVVSDAQVFVVSRMIIDKMTKLPPTLHYDLLILTPQSFQAALQPLMAHKNATGMLTTLMTLESIYQDSQYAAGWDPQEKIKMAIAIANKSLGIRYAMLVGDVDKFPVRYTRLWDAVHWGHGYAPSDLYYADLYDSSGNFDDWDSDNDNLFGEMNSGNPSNWTQLNQDNVDLEPDVGVGRIPASNVTELQRMVNKIISYEQSSPNHKIMLVTGNFANPHPTANHIASIMASIGFSNVKHYWTTDWTTIPSTDPQWATKRANLLKGEIDNGLDFAAYMGHGYGGSPGTANGDGGGWAGWYGYQSVANLNNAGKLPVILAAACDTAMFHYPHHPYEKKSGGKHTPLAGVPSNQQNAPEPAAVQPSKYDLDTMAEYFLVKSNVGGVAYMGGYTGLQPASFNVVRRFFEEFVALGGSATLGDVWAGGVKRYINSDFAGISNHWGGWYAAAIYHHIQKMMLFGDPSLRIGGTQGFYSICDLFPELCKPLVCKNCLIKYIYRGDPIRFLDPRDRYIIPIEEINKVFGKKELLTRLPAELDIHIESPTDSLVAAIYDDKGTLIVEDTSLEKSKSLHLRPERGRRYLLMLRPGAESRLGVLYELDLRIEGH